MSPAGPLDSREQASRARIASRLILPILALVVLFALLTQPSHAATVEGSAVVESSTVATATATGEPAAALGGLDAAVFEVTQTASGSPFTGEVMGIVLLGGAVMLLAGTLMGQTRLTGKVE